MDLSELNVPLIAIRYALLLFSLTVHETAHAWTSNRFGDPTARMLGRVSLNPLAHIDPIGTVVFPLLGMIAPNLPVLGWAKPVPVNPLNLKSPKRMGLWISAAGPLSNLVLASLFLLVLFVFSHSGLSTPTPYLFDFQTELQSSPLTAVLKIGFAMNVMLAFFNLLPVPPLDGGGVLAGMLPASLSDSVESLGRFGFFLLLALIVLPVGGMNLLSWLLLPIARASQAAFTLAVGW